MEEARRWFWSCTAMTPKDRRNERRARWWTALWMASWFGVNLGISYEVIPRGVPGSLAALLPVALGVAMILAHRRFLREADELLRKIHLDALALSVGVGVVAGFTSQLLARTGAMGEVDGLLVIALMLATYSAGVFVGTRRFS